MQSSSNYMLVVFLALLVVSVTVVILYKCTKDRFFLENKIAGKKKQKPVDSAKEHIKEE